MVAKNTTKFRFEKSELAPAVLIISAFVLLSTENLFHYPVAIMSALGILEITRKRICHQSMKYLYLVFFLIWVPMFLSSVLATNSIHSWKTTFAYLHFLPAAYYMVLTTSRGQVLEFVAMALFVFCGFLILDGLVQFLFGQNIFGYPLLGDIVTGMFHPKQRLALYLAVLAPFCLQFLVNKQFNYVLIIVACLPYLFIVLVSLKRSSWLMLLFGLLLFALIRWKNAPLRFARGVIISLVVLVSVAALTSSVSSPFNSQIQHSVNLASGDLEIVDRSSNHRLSLWSVGLKVFVDNPLLGVGPRGYRYNYENYAGSDNFWIQSFKSGQTHPHLMGLEILVETGVVGLLSYVLVLVLFHKVIKGQSTSGRVNCWLIGATVAWLPINTHLAFYGSYWASFVWLLIGIGFGYHKRSLNSV